MYIRRCLIRVLSIVAVVVIALNLRLLAVQLLPQDYDEPVYFLAGQHYAAAIRAGNWGELVHYEYNLEHPPLNKLLYGAALTLLPPIPEIPEQPTNPPPAVPYPLPQPHFLVTRLTSAIQGALQVLALALLNPLAGLFLAIHTFTIKYTSQTYLEALPSLTSTVAVLAYWKSKSRWNGWLIVSAVALGLTAAAKYLYCIAGVAIVAHWLWTRYPAAAARKASALARWLVPVALWGLLAVAVFFAADPFLWQDPIGRLKASMLFNTGFAQSEHVRNARLPVWQPFVWLAMSVPWHPGVFLVAVDLLITLLALAGLRRQWQARSVFAVWLIVGVGFLLIWPTRWPQYILVLVAPLSLVAAEGFRGSVWAPLTGWLRRTWIGLRQRPRRAGQSVTWRETRRTLLWLLPGVIVLSLFALFPMIYQAAMSLTDFSATAIRDGLGGGVWREVWRGLTGQVEPVSVDLFGRPSAKTVHYAGFTLLLQLLFGAASSVVVYEVVWTVLAVGLQTALGLAVALMIQRHGVLFKRGWRTLFILPWAIPEFVGALIWSQIFDPRFG